MKLLLAALLISIAAASPLAARDLSGFTQDVVLQLDAQGYQDFTVGRTWLGRIVITARRGEVQREIVLNARTGEILGDYAGPVDASDTGQFADSASSSGDDGGGAPGLRPTPNVALIDPLAATVGGPKDSKGGRD